MIVASAQSYVSLFSLASAAAYLLAATLTHVREHIGRSGAVALAIAWGCQAVALWLGLTQPPRFGFGPALSMTAWWALLVYAVESRTYSLLQLRWRLALVGAVTVMLAWLFPGNELHPHASEWLPLHLMLGMASYGLLAVAVLHAWLMGRAERHMRLGGGLLQPTEGNGQHGQLPLMTLERLTFRFVLLAFILLTVTIAQGWIFGEQLYGGAAVGSLRWNHKTVFSVLSWLVLAVLLAGRYRFGWRGQRSVRMIYLGGILLLLAYVGSSFVLEVLLHRPAE